MKLARAIALAFGCGAFAVATTAVAADLVIATVNNGHMIEMQKLTPHFEKANPDIKLKWVTLEEGVLRQRVTTDIATKGGQFDVMTIGLYEVPIWGKKGWLKEIKTDAAYDVDDLLPAIRNGLTVDGKLYAVPFYGESSMLMYRKDLADKAGVQVPERPPGRRSRTWPPRSTIPRTACMASACAASRAGATTWPSSPPWSTPLAASGLTCSGSRSSNPSPGRTRSPSTWTCSRTTAPPARPPRASTKFWR